MSLERFPFDRYSLAECLQMHHHKINKYEERRKQGRVRKIGSEFKHCKERVKRIDKWNYKRTNIVSINYERPAKNEKSG